MSFLSHISKIKRELVREKKSKIPLAEIKKKPFSEKRAFYETFSERFPLKPKIIAEVKKASPSKGILREAFDPLRIARIYEDNGASAISVITEEQYFQGSLEYLKNIRSVSRLPLLRKDFIVDEYEIFEAKAYGADCVLLISEMLDRSQIKDYLAICREIGLDQLIEVHGESAYEKLADLSGYLLGINNRDLESLKIDVSNGLNLLKKIPPYQPVIIESGIEEKELIKKYLLAGVSGFLIGTSFMVAEDIASRLKDFLDVSL